MTMRVLRAAAMVVLLVLVAGCTETPSVTRLPGAGPTTVEVPPSNDSTADLPALKKAAGIADCPVSDPDVPTVSNGLPDVVVSCLGGGRDVRLAGLRGRPMLISLWAQWCSPCRAEAPFLAEVSQRSGSKLMVLGVDFHDGYPDRAIEFARLAKWDYPHVVDTGAAFAPLQVTAPPVTFLVRGDGTIADQHFGAFGSTDEITTLVRDKLGVSL